MPTGYTAYIENGKITNGKEFLTLCCRAFGVCVDMREESLSTPIPNEFKMNDYYEKSLLDKREKLEKAKRMTIEEAKQQIMSSREAGNKELTRIIKKNKQLGEGYSKIREEIIKWMPPTTEHEGLKKFALEQIDISAPSKDTMDYYIEAINEKEPTPEEYIENNIKRCEEDLKYAEKRYAEELKRVADNNKWLDDFRKSLLTD